MFCNGTERKNGSFIDAELTTCGYCNDSGNVCKTTNSMCNTCRGNKFIIEIRSKL